MELTQYDTFYNGQIKSKWRMMLIEVINKDPMIYSGSNSKSAGISISDKLFSFMLENILSAVYVD